MGEESALLKLEKKHIIPVSLLLQRAFQNGEQGIFSDPEEEKLKSPYITELYLRSAYPFTMAFITSPKMEGVIIWLPSDFNTTMSFWKILSSGALWSAIRIGRKTMKRLNLLDRYADNKRIELAPPKHWYLWSLAVDPKYQGMGYASKLLNQTLHQIDKERLPCFLEAEGEKNTAMYRHFGFKVVGEYSTPGTTEKTIAMLRMPRRGRA